VVAANFQCYPGVCLEALRKDEKPQSGWSGVPPGTHSRQKKPLQLTHSFSLAYIILSTT